MVNRGTGHFINPHGYSLFPSDTRPGMFEFTLDESAPVSWLYDTGLEIQPDRHHFRLTDCCSTPWYLQWIPVLNRFKFALEGIFHDSGYFNHGRYVRYRRCDEFRFETCPRELLDNDLHNMVSARSPSAADLYWVGVRLGGWAIWRRYRKEINRRRNDDSRTVCKKS